MSGLALFLFVVAAISELAFWVVCRNTTGSGKQRFLIAIAIPQAAFLIFVVVRIAVALLTGATV